MLLGVSVPTPRTISVLPPYSNSTEPHNPWREGDIFVNHSEVAMPRHNARAGSLCYVTVVSPVVARVW